MRPSLPRYAFSGVLSIVMVIVGFVSAAHADPISDEQAKAAAIQDSIEANGARISALSEQYDAAQLRLQQSEQTAAAADFQIAADQAQVTQIRATIGTRARNLYERSTAGESLAALDLTGAQQVLTGTHYADAAALQEQHNLKVLSAATADLARTRDAAKTALEAAASDAALIEQTAQQLQAANEEQYATLGQVRGTLQQLVAQDQARREAQNLAAAQAHYGSAPSAGTDTAAGSAPAIHAPSAPTTGGPASASSATNSRSGSQPPSQVPALNASSHLATPIGSSGSGIAIAFARAQLGKPYRFAAAGPDAYDCSGLTMAAWSAAGVRLPHYSGAQYAMLPHVPLSAMIPGDLVFWGPGGGQHVGLYIGGGLMIAAPTTGDVVKIQAIWGHPIGAARP